jgi:uncharacterized protein YbbK (DUF523 family)
MYIISACLIGVDCKYNGGNNKEDKIIDYLRDKNYVPICPEQLGGLTTPRNPVEIIGESFFDAEGRDYTEKFLKGAEESLKIVDFMDKIEGIILKEGSPSCGVNKIYDGSFTNQKVQGIGCTAKLLKENNYQVISENELLEKIK